MQTVVDIPFFETVTIVSLGPNPAQGSTYARYDCDAQTALAILAVALRAVENTMREQAEAARQAALAQQTAAALEADGTEEAPAEEAPAPEEITASTLDARIAAPEEPGTPTASTLAEGVSDGNGPAESN